MQWSQLKHRVEAQFAPKLQGRVCVWAARYRGRGEEDGRGWFTLDGVQIYSMADVQTYAAECALRERIFRAVDAPPGSPESEWAQAPERFLTYDHFRKDLHAYLECSIEDLIDQECPLLRGLAMLDRRLGKRRFLRLENIREAHPLTQRLYLIRGEVEQWPTVQLDACREVN